MGRLAIMVKKVAKGGAAPKIDFPRSAVVAKKRTFSIGGDVLPQNRDLTRFVRWPKYVRLQGSKMTLLKRIKIPPAINQFSNTFDKRQASQLFRLLNNLKPDGEDGAPQGAGRQSCRWWQSCSQETNRSENGHQPRHNTC